MKRLLFGTDGIRGEANRGHMTPEIAFRIGAAVTYQMRKRSEQRPRIVIGKDTRISGYLFETALASGICTMGGQVMLSGPLPTPAVAHLTTSMRADAGFVISASHNPYGDNGIKIFGHDGFKLPDSEEYELEKLIASEEIDRKRPRGTGIGNAIRLDDAPGRYVSFVKATFPPALTLDGIKIVVDAAHGAAYRTAPLVFSELGATVFPLGVKPNGKNINERCGALHPEHASREVRKRKAHCGLALDGDADRVILVDEKGQVVDGDTVMALCASRMLQKKTLRKKTVVATVMSNLGLEKAVASAGGTLRRCPVGDRYVVEEMRKRGLNFGGEQSGHLIFLDHATTGDGLVAALQVLAILREEGRDLSELAADAMERVPQTLLSVRLSQRRPLSEMPSTCKKIDACTEILGTDGRVLVRWSGTESKLRIMVEGPSKQQIERLATQIAKAAEKELGG